MEMLYGITVPEDEWEEIALIGWNLIGNKRVRLYKYTVDVCDNKKDIQLPCNADIIEAVTSDFEEWADVTNDTPNGNITSAYIEDYIERRKTNMSPLYASGKFIRYERVGDKLYFDKPYSRINILYKGIILDDNGLPELTDKEATALATYVAYIQKFKEGIQANNATLLSVAQTLKAKWDLQCDQARVGYTMSQNEYDQILDAKTMWCRKQHNRSFKINN